MLPTSELINPHKGCKTVVLCHKKQAEVLGLIQPGVEKNELPFMFSPLSLYSQAAAFCPRPSAVAYQASSASYLLFKVTCLLCLIPDSSPPSLLSTFFPKLLCAWPVSPFALNASCFCRCLQVAGHSCPSC